MFELGNLSDTAIRLSAFIGIFVAMAALELLIPKRRLQHSKGQRWFTNISIGGIDSLIVRFMALIVIPLSAVAAALWAESAGWGLLNWLGFPYWLNFVIALVVLDLAIYGQHVASHKIPMFWLLHRVHHSDVDFDVTTAIRFHPIEIALSMLWKIVVVLAIGAPAAAVVVFEIILNGCAMFNHSNIDLPKWLDRFLRLFLVTPRFSPGAPFGDPPGDRLKLRLQPVDLGPDVRHLHAPALERAQGHDNWVDAISERAAHGLGLEPDAAISGGRFTGR